MLLEPTVKQATSAHSEWPKSHTTPKSLKISWVYPIIFCRLNSGYPHKSLFILAWTWVSYRPYPVFEKKGVISVRREDFKGKCSNWTHFTEFEMYMGNLGALSTVYTEVYSVNINASTLSCCSTSTLTQKHYPLSPQTVETRHKA